MAWRGVRGCSPEAEAADPARSLGCDEGVPSGVAGWCECELAYRVREVPAPTAADHPGALQAFFKNRGAACFTRGCCWGWFLSQFCGDPLPRGQVGCAHEAFTCRAACAAATAEDALWPSEAAARAELAPTSSVVAELIRDHPDFAYEFAPQYISEVRWGWRPWPCTPGLGARLGCQPSGGAPRLRCCAEP